jgi:DNA-binding MarR family transcriptional regulator
MADDELDRLIAELTRYMRLMHRAKAFLGSGEAGADPSALLLLPPLVHMGPLRVTDLADLKQSDPSTVSRQVAQLVRAGLAHKEPDPADGRASRLAVTPEGEAACARLMGRRRAMLSDALTGWSAEAIASFATQFAQFNTAVEGLLRGNPGAPAKAGDEDDRENV